MATFQRPKKGQIVHQIALERKPPEGESPDTLKKRTIDTSLQATQIESWIKVESNMVASEFNQRRITRVDSKGQLVSSLVFDGKYRWEYHERLNKVLKMQLLPPFSSPMMRDDMLGKEPSDEAEFHYWLEQPGARFIGQRKLRLFDAVAVEITTELGYPGNLKQLTVIYFDKNTYEVRRHEDWTVSPEGHKTLVGEMEVISYEVLEPSQVASDLFAFKLSPDCELVEQQILPRATSELVRRIGELTSFRIYALKGKPLDFHLWDISTQYCMENLEQMVVQRYAKPDYVSDWCSLKENLIILIGHKVEQLHLLPDILSKAPEEKQMVEFLFMQGVAELSISCFPEHAICLGKLRINDEEVVIQAHTADGKQAKEEIKCVARHLAPLQKDDTLIQELEEQRISMWEKSTEEFRKRSRE